AGLFEYAAGARASILDAMTREDPSKHSADAWQRRPCRFSQARRKKKNADSRHGQILGATMPSIHAPPPRKGGQTRTRPIARDRSRDSLRGTHKSTRPTVVGRSSQTGTSIDRDGGTKSRADAPRWRSSNHENRRRAITPSVDHQSTGSGADGKGNF